MATTCQTKLFKAILTDFEIGWQLTEDIVIFESNEYEDVTQAMRELDFHEPSDNNWFATMVERIDDEVTDEEIFDSSVILIDWLMHKVISMRNVIKLRNQTKRTAII